MGLSGPQIEERRRILATGGRGHPGNAEYYGVETVAPEAASPLRGRTIVFLGSSVTCGTFAQGESFVDYLEARDGIVGIKAAVAGTSLVDDVHDGSSYVERIVDIDPSVHVDAFVCQLSTNDALAGKPAGMVSRPPYDTATMAGAMRFVIDYVRGTWGCPILFYTAAPFSSASYAEMVDLLKAIAEETGVGVIDLFNDPDLIAASDEDRSLYMYDSIHPTRAGYLLWWLPRFEEALSAVLT